LHPQLPNPPELEIIEEQLDNGLRVVLHPDSTLPLVAINLWYHVGSMSEVPGRTGLAHLFEHMLFQGSEHVGTNDHFRLVQQVGGNANGSTWYDRTNYYETLPAGCLDLGLWLEADRMGYLLPALDQKKLDTQRQVVINERRQRTDNQPYGRALEKLHQLLYPEVHPHHWPVIGWPRDLEATELEDVKEFFRRHYGPNNAVLTVAGDIEPRSALAAIDKYFGAIPSIELAPTIDHPLPALGRTRSETMMDRVALPRLYLAYRWPGYGERSWSAGNLLATILSGGRSSPMYRDLVHQRQLAQEVSCLLYPTVETAPFLVIATARPGVDPEALLAEIDTHIERAISAEISREDFDRGRNQLACSIFDELQSLDERADELSRAATLLGSPERFSWEIETYEALDAEEVRRIAAQYLSSESRVRLTVVPQDSKGRA